MLQDGAHYMIYTPSDPLLFVAVKVPSKFYYACWSELATQAEPPFDWSHFVPSCSKKKNEVPPTPGPKKKKNCQYGPLNCSYFWKRYMVCLRVGLDSAWLGNIANTGWFFIYAESQWGIANCGWCKQFHSSFF